MNNLTKNYVSSGIFMIFGFIIFLLTRYTVNVSGVATVGPREFPYFISIVMITLSLILLIQTLITSKRNKPEEIIKEKFSYRDELRVLIFIVLSIVYIFLFNRIGFIFSSLITSTLIMLMFNVKKIFYYLLVYIVIFIIYLSFTKLLYVMLP